MEAIKLSLPYLFLDLELAAEIGKNLLERNKELEIMLKSSHHYLEEQHIKNEVCIRNNFQLSMPGARKEKVWLVCVSLSRATFHGICQKFNNRELVRRLKRRNLVPWLFSFLFRGWSPGETHVRQKILICYLSNNSKSVGLCFLGTELAAAAQHEIQPRSLNLLVFQTMVVAFLDPGVLQIPVASVINVISVCYHQS